MLIVCLCSQELHTHSIFMFIRAVLVEIIILVKTSTFLHFFEDILLELGEGNPTLDPVEPLFRPYTGAFQGSVLIFVNFTPAKWLPKKT